MRLLILFLAALLLAAMPAHGQALPEPIIAPAPDWVERLPIPAPDPALRDRPAQLLLSTAQSLFGPDRGDHFLELAILVQNAQGLQGFGTIMLPWQPDQGDLIVHKVQIVRGATVIDLLANGQRFTVLRRENNLESAVLDGMLTAVMQAEGLAVGDILSVSFTMRRHSRTLPYRAENFFAAVHGQPIRRQYVRQIWPAAVPIQWRGTGVYEGARTRRTRLGTELIADLADVEGPETPANVPPRFSFPATLQLSQYRDWGEIGALLAPHYERAQQLPPDSPLRREIERIAAASPDPKVRTMAALRLVEDQVRYFALVMGEGNYLPATADQSWSRRFADCKGKVVLLLALLHGLGIDAEPVLVSSRVGDGLGDYLPMLAMFDHVIVRARIDGRSYWLDSTRTGDRNLDDLASSTYVWGLPLRASGGALEAMPFAPPALPLVETNTVYDGSGGFGDLVPVRVEQIVRGDLATGFRVSLSQLGRDQFLRQLRESGQSLVGEGGEIAAIDLRDDAETGAFAMVYTGRARMAWARAPGAAAQRFRFDNDTISWRVDFDRPAGPFRDAPFAFPVPAYVASTETVILPHGGAGFSIEGQNFDHLVAGVRISRQLAISGGRATARSEFRRMEREVPAAAARSSAALIERIRDDQAWLRAAMGTLPRAAAAPAAVRAAVPDTAEALVRAGFQKMDVGRVRPALADFDRAIELAPSWSLAHADRGIALIHLDRLDEAEAALATALRLDETEFAAHQGLGLLALKRGRPEQAVSSFTRSLELDAGNSYTRGARAEAYAQLGRFAEALADLDAILAAEPGHAVSHARRARILLHQGHGEEALAAIDRAIAADPGNFMLVTARGEVLQRLGREAEANAAYQSALAMFDRMAVAAGAGGTESADLSQPRIGLLIRLGRRAEAIAATDAMLRRFPGTVMMLAMRCYIRVEANIALDQARRDCDQAIRAEPGHPIAVPARALLGLRQQRWADALRDFAVMLSQAPRSAPALYGRGLARIGSGDSAGGQADIAAARRLAFDVDWEFRRIGIAAAPD